MFVMIRTGKPVSFSGVFSYVTRGVNMFTAVWTDKKRLAS